MSETVNSFKKTTLAKGDKAIAIDVKNAIQLISFY